MTHAKGGSLNVTKAVFPVAGMGTRFLPATKASPKEMLPVVDKPLIQYAVEEAVAAGITHMVFITGRNKRAIEDHFDKAYELETELKGRNRHKLLDAGAGHRAQARDLHLRAPVRGAGAGARGAVRQGRPGRRAVRRDPGRRPDRRSGPGAQADGRDLRAASPLRDRSAERARGRKPAATASSRATRWRAPHADERDRREAAARSARHRPWPWWAATS